MPMTQSMEQNSPGLFYPFLQASRVVILDGALATELERKGANLADPLWSARVLVESPELIRQVHLEYLLAGADVITTASYQASFEGFSQRGLSHSQAEQLFRLSVRLACEARDTFWSEAANREGRQRPLVAASIGPYGAFLADGSEYRGDYRLSEKALMDFHRPRLELLAGSEADLLAFETLPCLREGEALLRLLTEFPESQAWLSFSCRDDKSLNHGEPVEAAVALANSSIQIAAVGVNCTHPRFVSGLLRRAAAVSHKLLLAYPNSGEIWEPTQKCWLPAATPQNLAALAVAWYQAGARLIGGCCRTRPEDIGKLRKILSR